MEHWREIPTFKKYEASTLGNIRNKATQHINRQITNNGYKKVALITDEGMRKCCRVNRMVALAWIPNPNNYTQVDHVNEDKANNGIENLEWVSASENCKRRFVRNPNCIKPVPLKFENGEQTIYFANSREAARHFEIASATVWGASINGKWKGYKITRITLEEFNQIQEE